ncbi:hypothetical protein QT346_08850 [Escherichia coli]|nr:hypothetical protein [Escherichia coli]
MLVVTPVLLPSPINISPIRRWHHFFNAPFAVCRHRDFQLAGHWHRW